MPNWQAIMSLKAMSVNAAKQFFIMLNFLDFILNILIAEQSQYILLLS